MEERKIPLSPGRQGDGVQLLGLGFRGDGGLFRVSAAAGHQDDGSAEDHHQTGDGKDRGTDAAGGGGRIHRTGPYVSDVGTAYYSFAALIHARPNAPERKHAHKRNAPADRPVLAIPHNGSRSKFQTASGILDRASRCAA